MKRRGSLPQSKGSGARLVSDLKERGGYQTSGPVITQHNSKNKLDDSERSKAEGLPRDDANIKNIMELERNGETIKKKKLKALPPLLS